MIEPKDIYVTMRNGSYTKVRAFCVAGEDGLLAFWKSGVCVYIASGDDGQWNEIYLFRINWLDKVFLAFQAFYNSVSEEEKSK